MKLRRIPIILIFRVLWVILALGLLLFIIARNIYTQRQLIYHLDFRADSTRDYRGWYPSTRTNFDSQEQRLYILGEPIYMKLYLPLRFDTMSIQGSWSQSSSSTVRLGLKQKDESWFYKDIDQKDWSANFDLQQVKVHRNQIEIIISIPEYQANQNIFLTNNWQIKFQR